MPKTPVPQRPRVSLSLHPAHLLRLRTTVQEEHQAEKPLLGMPGKDTHRGPVCLLAEKYSPQPRSLLQSLLFLYAFSWILYLQRYIISEQWRFYFFYTNSYAPYLFSCLRGVPRPPGGAWRGMVRTGRSLRPEPRKHSRSSARWDDAHCQVERFSAPRSSLDVPSHCGSECCHLFIL